jgi:hypothetical protein
MSALGIVTLSVLGLFVLSSIFGRRHGGCAGGSWFLKLVGTMAIVGGIALFWSRSSEPPRDVHVDMHRAMVEDAGIPDVIRQQQPARERLDEWRQSRPNINWIFVLMGTVLIIGGSLLFSRDRTRPVAFKAFTVLGIAAILYIVTAFFSSSSHRAPRGHDTVVRLERVSDDRPARPEVAARPARPERPKHAKRPKSRPQRPVAERVSEELPPRAGEIPVAAELAHDEVRAAVVPEAGVAPAATNSPAAAETPAEPAAPPVAEAPAEPTAPAAAASEAPAAASAPATASEAPTQPPAAEPAQTPSAPASALAPEPPSASEPPAAAAPVSPAAESEQPESAAAAKAEPAAPADQPEPTAAVEVTVAEPKIVEPKVVVPVTSPSSLSVAIDSVPRPQWVDAPARLVKSVYSVPVRSGLFASLPECQGQLSMQIKREADHYIDELLHDLGEHASQLVDISPEYLERYVKKAEYSEIRVSDSVGPMHQVHALLEFDDEARANFRHRWHDAVVTDRLWFTGAGAALVLALLGTFYGYLRLDTQTGGAHKGKLQLAATLAALIAAAAALMVRQAVPF